jgi:hypothetical protein
MRTPAAAEAERHPPSCLAGFRHRPAPLVEGALTSAIEFKLGCRQCPGVLFRISAFPIVAADPSPFYGVAPGETFNRPPHTLKCVACGREHALFDVRTQGYDGVLNGGAPYQSGTEGKAFLPGTFHVAVVLIYNNDLEELEPLAREAKVAPSDLFDWISIVGTATQGGKDVEFGYECA